MMRPVIPYSRQNISDVEIEAVTQALRAPFLTQGPAIADFEQQFANLHAMNHGVAVSNATAGLHIACLALGAGPGKTVWTSPNSFVASANCARYCGAAVDFVDIDPVTRNMSIQALQAKLEQAKRDQTLPAIVIPVDFAGYPADMAEIRELADLYGFKIISDSSHAVGASYQDQPVGHLADISVFSFHPVKIVTTGEGGLCLTNCPALASSLRRLRSHGITREASAFENEPDGPWYYEQQELGFNYRLTDIQATLGSAQLGRLAEFAAAREALAARYDGLLADLPLFVRPRSNDRQSANHLYVIELDDREDIPTRREVFDTLLGDQISPNVHYIPVHLQPDFRRLGFGPGHFPNCERYYKRAITIPLFPALTHEEQDRVVSSLKAALGSHQS